MRADRLVSVLLVLQRRGQVTVAEIAKELEISPRTARRDLEALGMAGLPVYSVPGRGGGWRLLGEGRTDLSGLSSAEAVALFARLGMVGGTPQPEMAGALRKLSRALPATFRETAERAASSIRTTEAPRGGPAPELDAPVDERMLSLVRDSVVRARRAEMVYTAREGALSTRLVEPLGLVARGARWYLIATTDRGQRTFRLDRIEGYRMLDEPATRPADFDLDAVWAEIAARMDDLRWQVRATVRVAAGSLPRVQALLGERLLVADSTGSEAVGGVIRGWSIAELAAQLAGLHPWVRVLGPPELRQSLADLGHALLQEHRLEEGFGSAGPGSRPEVQSDPRDHHQESDRDKGPR